METEKQILDLIAAAKKAGLRSLIVEHPTEFSIKLINHLTEVFTTEKKSNGFDLELSSDNSCYKLRGFEFHIINLKSMLKNHD